MKQRLTDEIARVARPHTHSDMAGDVGAARANVRVNEIKPAN